ncbi:hypothetical protein RvY_14933-1 [Ramazzottius varieornatus]|uniref:Uncharacterized protein n=1 Tax=Ramazzottius varieornatus TaxID=947166 RepID=A0A1D1VT13_RAMVA|nr:hypothetical protein RvY_14933-1 [Ramazzottius varieornatus]
MCQRQELHHLQLVAFRRSNQSLPRSELHWRPRTCIHVSLPKSHHAFADCCFVDWNDPVRRWLRTRSQRNKWHSSWSAVRSQSEASWKRIQRGYSVYRERRSYSCKDRCRKGCQCGSTCRPAHHRSG